MKKSQITFLIATMLLVTTLAPVYALPILAGRSADPKTVQSALNSTGGKVGSTADVNASRGNIANRLML